MKNFNAKKTITVLLFLFLLCLSFCSCKSETLPESPDITESGITDITSQTAADAVVTKDSESGNEETKAETTFAPLVIKEEDFNFTPVLTEDDIEYMGIPYNELTPEQFVQLWAQCTRECNIQRLYVITCENDDESADIISRKKTAETDLAGELVGHMPYCFYDVELHEYDTAPEGYYDNENAEELHYSISFRNVWYDQNGIVSDKKDNLWITLIKKDGYWKMRSIASSPYFFENQ